jgi:hypothetical protein
MINQVLKYLAVAAITLASTSSRCDSADLIYAPIKDGSILAVQTKPPFDVWQVKLPYGHMPPGQQSVPFEGCSYSVTPPKPGAEEIRTLACPQGGVTALSGTRYIGKPANGTCENREADYIYKCVIGCGKKSQAPAYLRQDKKECPQFNLFTLTQEK